MIKTKLQAQGGFRAQQANPSQGPGTVVYQGMLGTARVIWREEGLRGMYRGLGPIILGYLPTWAVWFTVYGKSKGFFAEYNGMIKGILYLYILIRLTYFLRKPKHHQLLVINCRGSFLNHGYQSDMGDQDSTHVTS